MGHGKSEYLRLNEENEKANGDEATQRGMEKLYQRQCGNIVMYAKWLSVHALSRRKKEK